MAEIVAGENVLPTIEKLKNIRERSKYGRKMNGRLHSMRFRKIQFCIAYKSMEYGFKAKLVDARNTSKACQICGEVKNFDGHVFNREKSDFQAGRHLIAV